MKSEKAREYLKRTAMSPNSPLAQDEGFVWGDDAVIKTVELAEQEAEERIQTKAMEAFCAANCPKGCSFGADGNIGCGAKARFIQKLAE